MKRIVAISLCLGLAAAAARAEVTIQRVVLDPQEVMELGSALAGLAGPAEASGPAAKEEEEGERQYLIPYWTSAGGSGVTTVFGLTNCHSLPVTTEIEYFDSTWELTHSETLSVPANGLRTFNARDRIGEGITLDGVIRITSSEKIMVDATKVETGAERASGTSALRYGGKYGDVVAAVTGRAFRGGTLGLGTVFALFLTAPQGAAPTDPPTFIVFVHDRDGDPVAALLVGVSQMVGSLDFSEIAAAIGFTGVDAKLLFVGNSAAVAAALGLEAPSEDVQLGGWVIQNAGERFNVADKLKRHELAQ